ncbi:hypothetical protein, partial [Salmonella enterica]|uniref:hypothetical protein n=1 Tax=Salmonella enterica TaxID=28901 RepID=UPI003299DD88
VGFLLFLIYKNSFFFILFHNNKSVVMNKIYKYNIINHKEEMIFSFCFIYKNIYSTYCEIVKKEKEILPPHFMT